MPWNDNGVAPGGVVAFVTKFPNAAQRKKAETPMDSILAGRMMVCNELSHMKEKEGILVRALDSLT